MDFRFPEASNASSYLRRTASFLGYSAPRFQIFNNWTKPIGKIKLSGTYITKGRKAPWSSGKVILSVSGGIEPREVRITKEGEASWFGWAKFEKTNGGEFDFKVIGLFDHQGKALFEVYDFTEQDSADLEALKKEVSEGPPSRK